MAVMALGDLANPKTDGIGCLGFDDLEKLFRHLTEGDEIVLSAGAIDHGHAQRVVVRPLWAALPRELVVLDAADKVGRRRAGFVIFGN